MRKSFFTLLELILASLIFAMLAFTAGLGVLAIQQSWKRIHHHSERLKNLMAIDRMVELCFRNIIPFTWPEEDTKKEIPIFTGDSDKILFATLHKINTGDFNAIRFVRLFLENGNLVAEYRNTPIRKDETENDGIIKEILATDIKDLSFLYLDRDETENVKWENDWVEDYESGNANAPLAIQMTVEWNNGDKYSWLRRTAGAGASESLGKRDKKGPGGGGSTNEPKEPPPE